MSVARVGSIGNRTGVRSERVRLLIQTDEFENTVQTAFHWCITFIIYILSFNIFPMTINS